MNQETEMTQLLQDLVVNNQDLEKLESLLEQFNIFEVLNSYRQEMRHSDFLAYLLNPTQNHGLGDLFIKRLLQEAIIQSGSIQTISPIDLDLWDLDNMEVRREWLDIDILLLDTPHQLVVIIENKVFSGEHSDQLNRYQQIVKQHFPGYTIIKLFLTPNEDEPSDLGYIKIGYNLICRIIEDITKTRESILGQEITILMKHYIEILRRYLVGDSEIERLCMQIYKKHQRALDKIIEFLPDQQALVKEFLCDKINGNSNMVPDRAIKSEVDFIPQNWDFVFLRKGEGWTSSGKMLLFAFLNGQDSLKLHLVIGPGPTDIREKVYGMVLNHQPPFMKFYNSLPKKFTTIYKFEILTKNDYMDKSIGELKDKINDKWEDFLKNELPKLDEIIKQELKDLEI